MQRHFVVPRRSRWQPLVFGVLIAAALLGFVLASNRAASGAVQGPTVALVVDGTPHPGQDITVRVVAYNMTNLAGFQSTVSFDAASLRNTGTDLGTDLTRSGRDLLPLGPVLRDGSTVLGAATCPVAQCTDPRVQQARRITNGVNGQVELGTVSFYTESTGQFPLKLSDVKLVDPQGNLLPVSVADTVLDVTAP